MLKASKAKEKAQINHIIWNEKEKDVKASKAKKAQMNCIISYKRKRKRILMNNENDIHFHLLSLFGPDIREKVRHFSFFFAKWFEWLKRKKTWLSFFFSKNVHHIVYFRPFIMSFSHYCLTTQSESTLPPATQHKSLIEFAAFQPRRRQDEGFLLGWVAKIGQNKMFVLNDSLCFKKLKK